MSFITINGVVYEEQVSQVPVNIEAENYKLEAWKAAIANDARELAEYQAKIADIDALPIADEYKEILKQKVVLSSPSGITQAMVDEQQARVDAINGSNG